MLRRLFELGAEPIYGTFRDVNLEAAMTTATWRVYFRANRCPPALVVGGQPCDQLLFDGRLFPAQAKDAAFPSQRRGFGQRSPHALDLSPPISSARSPSTPPHPAAPESKRSYASVVRNGTPAPQKPRMSAPAVQAVDTTSVLSLSTNAGSWVTPPGSPRSPPTRLAITDGSPNSSPSGMRKAKRQRCAEDFATVMQKTKPQPKPATDIATSNYFAVLSTVEVELEACDAMLDDSGSPRYQIVPRKIKVPATVKDSKESSHFLTRHHNSVVKTKEAKTVADVAADLALTEKAVKDSLQPAKLKQANDRVKSVLKTLRSTGNPDTLTHMASSQSPIAFNAALLQEMSEVSPTVGELAQLHLVNRVLSASDSSNAVTFAHKWAKYFGGDKVPKKRDDVFRAVAHWWRDEQLAPVLRATRALALFELMLMCTAPQIFEQDGWIQRLTGHPTPWIPAQNRRLLHPCTLFALLRSDIGKLCFELWSTVQWQGDLLDDLDYLRDCDVFFPEDGVLQLASVGGKFVLASGTLTMSS
ncbi:hypothetical protein P43SY_011967 [Pythium insidiosum]|uniref:Uncharacterized protein n=1 Tax=Pythium insidiosum TaxID=114742 RepID=A0AAD5L7A8_PYTIN|nr:hypothetical protein P43SY_011967 [Pythium insidiosum]